MKKGNRLFFTPVALTIYSIYVLFIGYMAAKFVEKYGFYQSISYFVMIPMFLLMALVALARERGKKNEI